MTLALPPRQLNWYNAPALIIHKPTPPTGALDAITAVLDQHAGDSAIMAAATQSLRSMATVPQYAAAIVKSGCMMSLMESVAANPTAESVPDVLGVFSNVSLHAPELLLEAGAVDVCAKLIEATVGSPAAGSVTAACVRVLERLNRVPGASLLVQASGIVPTLLSSLATEPSGGDTEGDVAEPILRLLDRMCRDPTLATYVRDECHGLPQISAALASIKGSEAAHRIGGRLLTKLAAGNIAELVRQLKDTSDVAESEYLSKLLANLAMEDETAEKIVASGGTAALVRCLAVPAASVVAACATCIERVAKTSADNVAHLAAEGALPSLLDALKAKTCDATVASSALQAIVTLLRGDLDGAQLADLIASDGDQCILTVLKQHQDAESAVAAGLSLLDAMAIADFDLGKLLKHELLELVLECAAKHLRSERVQVAATRVFNYLCCNEDNAEGLHALGAGEHVLALLDEGASTELAGSCLHLLASLALLPQTRRTMQSEASMASILKTMSACSEDAAILQEGRTLLSLLADEGVVSRVLASLPRLTAAATRSGGSETASAALTTAFQQLSAFALVPDHTHLIVGDGSGAVSAVAESLQQLSSTKRMLGRSKAVEAACQGLSVIAKSVIEDREAFAAATLGSGALQAAAAAVKAHPKDKAGVSAAMRFIELATDDVSIASAFRENGGIDTCVNCLRVHPVDCACVLPCLRSLLKFAGTEEGCLAVARQGGTRQVLATLKANQPEPDSPLRRRCIELCLAIIQRVAELPEGGELLMKQGSLDVVLDAAGGLGTESAAARAASRALSHLLDGEDVRRAVEASEAMAASAARNIKHAEGATQLLQGIRRLGHMSTVPEHCDSIVKSGGVSHIAGILEVALHKCDDKAVQNEVVEGAMGALANLAMGSPAVDISAVAPLLSQCLTSDVGCSETLRALHCLATNPETAAALAADTELLQGMLEALKTHNRDTKTTLAGFKALATLGKSPAGAAAVCMMGGLKRIVEWADENSDEASATELAVALSSAASLCQAPESALSLCQDGMLEVIKNSLPKFCSLGPSASQLKKQSACKLCCACAKLLSKALLHGDEVVVQAAVDTGVLRKVLKFATSNQALVEDDACAEELLQMLHAACGHTLASDDIASNGAIAAVLGIMDCHGNSPSTLELASQVLHSLGMGSGAGQVAVDELNKLCKALEAAETISDAMIQELAQGAKSLSNLMMLDGVVTEENAAGILASLSDAVALLAETGSGEASALIAGVQSIGRLAAIVPSTPTCDAIEYVYDTWTLHSHNKALACASIAAMGSLAASPAAALLMSDLGALEKMLATGKQYGDDTNLQDLISTAMQKVMDIFTANSSWLAGEPGGGRALAHGLKWAAADKSRLEGAVAAVQGAPSGAEALWAAIPALAADSRLDVLEPIMRSLRNKDEAASAKGIRAACSEARVEILLEALKKSLHIQSDAHASESTKALALAQADDAMTLLACTNFDADGAFVAGEDGLVPAFMSLLGPNQADSESVALILSTFRNVVEAEGTAVLQQLGEAENMQVLESVLAMYVEQPGHEDITGDVLALMAASLAQTGLEESTISRGGFRSVRQVESQEKEKGGALHEQARRLVETLGEKYDDATAQAMSLVLGQAQSSVEQLEFSLDDSGGISAEQVTIMHDAMQAVRMTADELPADNIVRADAPMLGQVVRCLHAGAKVANTLVVANAAHVLRKLATMAENCMEIARQGGIDAVIAAVRENPHHKELLNLLLDLIERISRHDEFKAAVAAKGGVDIIINIGIGFNVENSKIAVKCLSTLANLAFNSPANIALIMQLDGVRAVERAMQAHPSHRRLLENAMCTLSNLMFGSDENKLVIGQTCGDEVTHVIRMHHTDANLFKMALRALGNLAYCDENIRFVVVEHKATEVIVQGMDDHAADEEALQLAMEVLGNFASLEEEPGEAPGWTSISQTMLLHGGPQAVVRFMNKLRMNTTILKSGVDALSNVANDGAVADVLTREHNLISTVTDIVRMHDWDEELIQHALPLLATLTYTKEAVTQLATEGGLPLVQDALEQQLSLLKEQEADVLTPREELALRVEMTEAAVSSAMVAITNLAAVPAGRQSLRDTNGVRAMLKRLQQHQQRTVFVQEALLMLTRCSSDDEIAQEIAQLGMHIIMQTIDQNMHSSEILTAAFRLLGHLAFVEENLSTIVQHDGIQKIVAAIAQHADARDLMMRSIQTLDNIAMANKEYARLVIEENGRDLIEMILEAFADDEEIVQYGKSALLSINSLDRLAQSEEAARKAALAAAEARAKASASRPDPLRDVRHFLSAGQVVSVWTKGTSKPAHMLISADFRSIVWQEPSGAKKKLGALDLGSVLDVQPEAGKGHNIKRSAFRKAANPECCFTVQGERSQLCVETNIPPDVMTWVESLHALLKVFRTDKSLLVR